MNSSRRINAGKPCRQASFVDVRPYSLLERRRDKIDFANQTRAVLIVDQRRVGAVSEVEFVRRESIF